MIFIVAVPCDDRKKAKNGPPAIVLSASFDTDALSKFRTSTPDEYKGIDGRLQLRDGLNHLNGSLG
jgi:hypothetical protein